MLSVKLRKDRAEHIADGPDAFAGRR